jgi:hypothetical protein
MTQMTATIRVIRAIEDDVVGARMSRSPCLVLPHHTAISQARVAVPRAPGMIYITEAQNTTENNGGK